MTTANKITIVRILLIPVFVTLAVYYGRSVEQGAPVEWQRIAAIIVFVIAAASDGVDGYIARHFNQRSRLGSILDPIADKGLLFSALLSLSFTNWPYQFPLWFPILVIARDLVVLGGTALLYAFIGPVQVRPTWTGKVATALQMASIAGAMLQLPWTFPGGTGASFLFLDGLVVATGVFTFVSGVGYVMEGIRLLQAGDPPNA